MTKIVNIKSGAKFDVYCGRPSKWGNPFTHIQDKPTLAQFLVNSREESIEKYRLWINSQPELLKSLPELKDKVLACHCVPLKCHCEILCELADSKYIKNWFSNMLPFDKPLIYQGLEFKTVENFYQAMKLPKNRLDLRNEIAKMGPFEAKKSIKDKNKYKWDESWTKEKALEVMNFALNYKFAKGTEWHRKLLLTEDWELVEWNNWSDFFWGKDIKTLKGENHLGKLLMRIRDDKNRPLKVIIAGSRDILDKNLIREAILESGFNIKECVCGTASGVDSVGRQICLENDIKIVDFPAQWHDLTKTPCIIKLDKNGRKYNVLAGFNRNKEMAEYADALICVHNGSPGSLDMILTAQKHNLLIFQKMIKE